MEIYKPNAYKNSIGGSLNFTAEERILIHHNLETIILSFVLIQVNWFNKDTWKNMI